MARQFRSDDTSVWSDRYGNNSDGNLTVSTPTTFSNPKTTATGTQGGTALTVGSGTGFSNGNLVLIHQSREGGDGAGVWELNKISSVGGGTNWTMAYSLENDYATTAQVIKILQNSNITINNTLSAPAWDGSSGGIIVLMGEDVGGSGTINLSGTNSTTDSTLGKTGGGYRGGNGTVNVNNAAAQAEGTTGAGAGTGNPVDNRPNNGNGGGGTRGTGAGDTVNSTGFGGGGGNGTAGGNGTRGGTGGTVAGNAQLTTMVFGGGGGGCDQDTNAPGGASGGGILIVIAKNIDFSSMTLISANGGNGIASTNNSYNGAPTSGSGAGGSVLLKGQAVVLGTSKITAAGGTVTGGASGGDGRIHVDYSQSLSGTTSPTLDSSVDSILSDLLNDQGYGFFM